MGWRLRLNVSTCPTFMITSFNRLTHKPTLIHSPASLLDITTTLS
jgi:hypothetical protein